MEPDDFQHFLRQVRQRDPEAMNRWVDLFLPFILFHTSIRSRAPRLRAWRDSADNVQSTFRMCFQEDWPARFEGRSFQEAVAFFRRAAVNNLQKHLRRFNAARAGDLGSGSSVADPAQRTPSEIAEARFSKAVYDACRDDDQRAMIHMLLEGQGFTSVARKLGVGESTVRMAYGRVLDRVRKKLGEE